MSALQQNGHGELYSSDFPYFRLPNPEQYIGVIVPENLRDHWSLLIEGDLHNLPRIVSQVRSVDLFHYDSDKSYSGRRFAFEKIMPLMSQDGIVLMDDIQDNSFFYDFIQDTKPEHWCIYEFEGKYVGLIGRVVST